MPLRPGPAQCKSIRESAGCLCVDCVRKRKKKEERKKYPTQKKKKNLKNDQRLKEEEQNNDRRQRHDQNGSFVSPKCEQVRAALLF